MISPFSFVVSPENGYSYSSVKEIEGVDIVMSANKDNHKYTNRIAIVESVPLGYDGPIKVGNKLMVHHNVFREFHSTNGRLKKSTFHFKDKIYLIPEDQIYMYYNGNWNPINDYCFVTPVNPTDKDFIKPKEKHERLHGVIAITCSKDELPVGLEIIFKPHSEYEFDVDGVIMYRIKTDRICMKKE